MCINSFMIDTDIIKCVLEDLLDRICSINTSTSLNYSPLYYSSQTIEDKFNQSINILNNSIKQLLTYELNTVVNNGQLATTSNIRHSRYYNPTTMIKQTNDLKKRLHWIEQRQMIIKQLNLNENQSFNQINNINLNSMDNIWFNHRFKMLDNSLELLKKQDTYHNEDIQDEEDCSCARSRIYSRKKQTNSQLFEKIKHIYQIHIEHNYSNTRLPCSTPESNLIVSLSKIADRIGHNNPLNVSNTSKKHSSTTTIKKKQQQQQQPKLQSSISLIVTDTNKNNKRTLEESKNLLNSNFISNNYDLTNKRQKRIASPQSSLSVPSTSTSGAVNSSSPHDILTPSWRVLTNSDYENIEKSSDQQEIEDISDESYIHRHIRCELEQETWVTNPPDLKNPSLTSNRKNSTLQTSLSVPHGLQKPQYRYRITPNGIAYTETIDTK